MLLVSVSASAGMPASRHMPGSFFNRSAPSSKEYSEWLRR